MTSTSLIHTAMARLLCTVVAGAAPQVPRFEVHELDFDGPHCTPSDRPAADIELSTEWRPESGHPRYTIHGFWDGDGEGGTSGDVFTVRFCPTREGTWTLVNTHSNDSRLNNQHEGAEVFCTPSDHHGFWEPEGLWFRRSDSTYQYMLGNVHYCLVSVDSRLEDIRANKDYYKKLRFMIQGFGLCDGPDPFFASSGNGSSSGSDASRPNPAYFARIDEMIREGLRHDLIIDMYTDPQNHAIDRPGYLRYLAARFGSFPNVWLQVSIEWNEKYSAGETADLGTKLRSYLPYPTPLTTIGTHNWNGGLNAPCWTHVNIQGKVFGLRESALAIIDNRERGGGIICNNDDNGPNFEGYGGTTGPMEVERTLGCFLGAGYTGTGYKTGYKRGPYMFGGFDPDAHTCTRHLAYMRDVIDRKVRFWKMQPGRGSFDNASGFVWMGWADTQYVFGSNDARSDVVASLPGGTWHIEQFDFMAMESTVLAEHASGGSYSFDTPASVSAMTLFTRTDLTGARGHRSASSRPAVSLRVRGGVPALCPVHGTDGVHGTIIDMAGVCRARFEFDGSSAVMLPMPDYPPGVYLLHLDDRESSCSIPLPWRGD